MSPVFEPSDGGNPNFGPGTSHNDDGNHSYSDHDFFDLCGPGAADVALFYWPYPSNYYVNSSVTDTAHTSTTTDWTGERMRGYMTYVAWQTQIPGWSHKGIMDSSHYYSYGTTLYGIRDGLNWEASGHNTSNWPNYFYAIQWHDTAGQSTLLTQVESDVSANHVPVIAEVDAGYLTNANWPAGTPTHTYHFITIIGYDNSGTGYYYYTDTCANSTACGSLYDGGIRTASQATIWNAIYQVTVNKSTAPNAGDGGWVW